jgi:hypothetical protein
LKYEVVYTCVAAILEAHNPIYMLRLFSIILGFAIMGISLTDEKIRQVMYEGTEVKTTYSPDKKFIGKYQGKKSGYLLLKEDGTGEYLYDIFGPSSCKPGIITFEWGFLLDEKNNMIKIERDYGYSYPIVFKATSEFTFQGCSQAVFVDYILEYKNGDLHVSSSDDWIKR